MLSKDRGDRLALFTLLLLIPASVALSPRAHAQIAAGTGRFIGNAVGVDVRSDFKVYWNQLTPGNAGKWGSVEYAKDQYTWGPLDAFYQYSLGNGFTYKHHTLVWGNQQPSWITSVDSVVQRAQVEEWIKLVGQRYPLMSMVDVVNEPFHAVPSYAPAIGGSGTSGWDWVIQAFTWARQYCNPGAQLILNEYNVLHDNGVTKNYLRLIDTLRTRGLIDAIGIQGHYFEFRAPAATGTYTYSVATIKANLDRLVATGLPVYISEFDINEPVDSIQLANYRTYFPIFWDNPGVKGITLWGYVQGDIWQENGYLIRTDGTERPAMKWLRKYVASPTAPSLVAPVGGTGLPVNPLLIWNASRNASAYRLQLSIGTAFSTTAMDTTVADTVVRARHLIADTRYYWRVTAMNDSGAGGWSATGMFQTGTEVAGVTDEPTVVRATTLLQNFPNPFNPATRITVVLAERQWTRVRVYDGLGREIATLMDGVRDPGTYTVTFDGAHLAGGVYYCRLQAGTTSQTRAMLLVQ